MSTVRTVKWFGDACAEMRVAWEPSLYRRLLARRAGLGKTSRTRISRSTPAPVRLAEKSYVRANGCVEYGGKLFPNGYGSILYCGRNCLAHRLSFAFANGLDPIRDLCRGDVVRHSCDNKRCINPDHLLIGTHADNAADAVARHRVRLGGERREAKLTDEAVRQLRSGALSEKDACRQYGVFWMVARKAKLRYTWKHVQ